MRSFLTKAALALPLAAAGAYFRELFPALIVLAAAMASDYVTGMLSAWARRTLSSRIGLRGLVKKLGYIFGVGVAVTVDFIVQTAGERLGADASGFYLFGLLVTVWLIGNECISILENLSELGVPVPGFLKAAAARLKRTAERAAPEETADAAPSCHPERRRFAPESKDPDAEAAGQGKDLSTPHGTRAHRCAAGPLARSCSAQDDNGGKSAEAPAVGRDDHIAPHSAETGRPSQSASLTAPPEGEPRRCGAETAPSAAADVTPSAEPHLPPPLGEVPSEARRRGCVTADEPRADPSREVT